MKKSIVLIVMVSVLISMAGVTVINASDRDEFRSELYRIKERERMPARLVAETKANDVQTGRNVIDVHGNSVIIEKYIERPASNQIKATVLNFRPDIVRYDRSEWTGTFNQDLPESLSGIARQMWGSRFGRPEYYLTNVYRLDSNDTAGLTYEVTRDGGFLWKYDRRDHYLVLFDEEVVKINSIEKVKWDREGWSDVDNDNLPGSRDVWVPDANGDIALFRDDGRIVNWSIRPDVERTTDRDVAHCYEKTTFADGTWISWETYMIDDEGGVLPRPVEWFSANREVIHGASEFNGDSIDIVITPGQAEELGVDVE